ncbi:MAG: hypothetical protein RJA34_3014, partial [Pseudomonadota bacterium]
AVPACPMAAQADPHITTQCGPPAKPISMEVIKAVLCMMGLKHLGETAPVVIRLQVSVKNHGNNSNKEPTFSGDLYG